MELQDQLDAERNRRLPNDLWRNTYEEVLTTLGNNGFSANILAEDALFPDFVLPNSEGHLVSLAALLGHGPVLVQFFRGDWCPYCRLMLDALQGILPEIEQMGATLIALTPDTGPAVSEAKIRHDAAFDILSDVDCGIGLAAGVVFRLPPKYQARLISGGVDFGERHGNTAWFLPIPALFLLDRQGRVAWRFADIDFTHRASPARILDALRALADTG